MSKKRLVAGGAVLAAASALVLTTIPAASADVVLGPLETISTEVDSSNEAGWWSPLDEFNGNTYLAYNTDVPSNAGAHGIAITRRDSTGALVSGCITDTPGGPCVQFGDDPGHHQPSIAVDGDGYIHAFISMHNDVWHYYRSVRPEDPTEFVNVSAEMPDQEFLFTYPNIARGPNGDLWLMIRTRTLPRRAGARLYHWTDASDSWSVAGGTAFAYQASPERTVYPDDLQVTPDGDVHLVWEWQGGGAAGRHEGSYLRYHPATNTFHTADGAHAPIPATTTTPGLLYQPLEAGEQYGTESGVRVAKLALHQAGDTWVPTVGYRYKEETDLSVFKIRRAVFENGVWNRETVYAGPSDTTGAVDVTTDGSTERFYYATLDNGGTAFVAERTDGGEWTGTQIAKGKAVQRFSVRMRDDGTDVAYLCGPFATDTKGELYFRTLGRS